MDDDELDWLADEIPKLVNRPRKPGHAKIVAGEPRRVPPWEGDCPDCGKHLRMGAGISFRPPEEDAEREAKLPLGIALHWTEDCPAWKHRWFRFWHHHTWGRVERRWFRWKWRRRARKQRRDPEEWKRYWTEEAEE